MRDVSIIVVSWNTRPILLECLQAVRDRVQRVSAEVIVVDNASSDGSADAVAERYPEVRLVRNPMNFGFARAVNQGLRTAAGRYALLLNPDAIVGEGAVETLVDHMDRHPDCGLAGAQLLDPDGARQHSFDNCPTLATELLNKSLLRRLWPRLYPSKYQAYDQPLEVESLIGATILVRREAAADVGLLDEAYFLFLEETDWCLRMRRAGWRVTHVPAARVYHLQGQSKRAARTKARIEYLRSLYIFFRKHRGLSAAALLQGVRTIRAAFDWLFALTMNLATLGRKPRLRERWMTYTGVLLWHLALCPEDVGLRPYPWPPADAGPPLAPGSFLATARDIDFPDRLPDPAPFPVSQLLEKVASGDATWEVVEAYRWLPVALASPLRVEPVKDVRIKRVERVEVEHEGRVHRLLRKTYRAGGVWGALKWRMLGPRGYWEMWVGRAVAQRGVPFVPPVARAEVARGTARWESVVVVPLVESEGLDAALAREGGPRAARSRLMGAYGRFARRVHDAGVWQDDFDPNNVLLKGTEPEVDLALVDAERTKLLGRPLSREERVRNLAKLARFRRVTRTDRLRFLIEYVGGREIFRRATQEVAREVSAAGVELFRRDWWRARRTCLSRNRNYGVWRGRGLTVWYRRSTDDDDHPGVEAADVERLAGIVRVAHAPTEIDGTERVDSLGKDPADPFGRGPKALWRDLNAAARAGLPVVRPVLYCDRGAPLHDLVYVAWPQGTRAIPTDLDARVLAEAEGKLLGRLHRVGLALPVPPEGGLRCRGEGNRFEVVCGPACVPRMREEGTEARERSEWLVRAGVSRDAWVAGYTRARGVARTAVKGT